MTKTLTICDACEKPIDLKKGFVNLNPIRGGYTLAVGTTFGSTEKQITQELNLCGPDCLVTFVGKVADEIKPEAPAKTEAAA
jgi:hypothetical protein